MHVTNARIHDMQYVICLFQSDTRSIMSSGGEDLLRRINSPDAEAKNSRWNIIHVIAYIVLLLDKSDWNNLAINLYDDASFLATTPSPPTPFFIEFFFSIIFTTSLLS